MKMIFLPTPRSRPDEEEESIVDLKNPIHMFIHTSTTHEVNEFQSISKNRSICEQVIRSIKEDELILKVKKEDTS